MEEEIWKDIEGFEGMYQISSNGRVKSLPRTTWFTNKNGESKFISVRGRIMKPHKQKYLKAYLNLNGNTNMISVHRLVAMSFIPNPENKPQVNHVDGDKFNNNVNNLEWVTLSENRRHAFDTGLQSPKRGVKSHLATHTESDVINVLNAWNSGMKKINISRMYNVSISFVDRVVDGKSWRHIKI